MAEQAQGSYRNNENPPGTTLQHRLAELEAVVVHQLVATPADALQSIEEGLDLAETLEQREAIARFRRYLGLCKGALGDRSEALVQLRKAYRMTAEDQPAEAAAAALDLGDLYTDGGQYDKAADYYHRGLHVFEEAGNDTESAVALKGLGNVYGAVGDDINALTYYQEALRLYEKIGERVVGAELSNIIGGVQTRLGNLDEALLSYTDALRWFETAGDRRREADVLSNIGRLYIERKELDRAGEYLHRALAHFEELGDRTRTAETMVTIGEIYEQLHRPEAALEYHRKATEQSRLSDNRDLHASTLLKVGSILSARQNYEAAYTALQEALQTVEEQVSPKLAYQIHHALSQIFEAVGDPIKALAHHKHFARLKDAVLDSAQQIQNEQARIRVQLVHAEKERELYRLRMEHLEDEMSYKRKELTDMTLHLAEQSECLNRVREQLGVLIRKKTFDMKDLRAVADTIDQANDLEEHWNLFEQQFHTIHGNFLNDLAQRYPDLTPAELRICALLRINLSTKDIASLLHLSIRSVENHRYRIRKKMGMQQDENLVSYLATL